MPRDQVMAITDVIRFAPLVLILAIGLVGLWLLGRSPRRERADRSLAFGGAGVLALVAAGGVLFLAATLGQSWGGSAGEGLAAGVPLAVGAAAVVFVSGIGGYAALARPRVGSAALVGLIAGPLILAGLTAVAVRVTDPIRWSADRLSILEEQAQEQQARQERNAKLHLSASDAQVSVTTFRDPATGTDQLVFSSVRLTLVLRADVPIDFFGPDVGGYPEVWLRPTWDDELAQMGGTWPPTTGSHLPAGDTTWTVDFAYTPDQLAGRMEAPPYGPGAWTIKLFIMTRAGAISAEAPIQLDAPAPT